MLPYTVSLDRRGALRDVASYESGLITVEQKASFLAAASAHSNDQLHAFPIPLYGLHLDYKSLRVDCGAIFVFHTCSTAALRSMQADRMFFFCKKDPGRIARHQALHDFVARAFVFALLPVTKEPIALARQDSK